MPQAARCAQDFATLSSTRPVVRRKDRSALIHRSAAVRIESLHCASPSHMHPAHGNFTDTNQSNASHKSAIFLSGYSRSK